jgi:hypothetical protein
MVAARFAGRVDGDRFGDVLNALAVAGLGSRGCCRADQGPRVVIVPVIAASMVA